MSDTLTPQQRSARMALVKSSGNKSTELTVERVLNEAGIVGWVKHPNDILGAPDFYFSSPRIVLFVHGCFWHGCEKCSRDIPKHRRDFWIKKIGDNRRRDARIRRLLRRDGYHVVTLWEHALKDKRWLGRVLQYCRQYAPKHHMVADRQASYSPGAGSSTPKLSRK